MHQSGGQYGAQEFEGMILCNQMANAAHRWFESVDFDEKGKLMNKIQIHSDE